MPGYRPKSNDLGDALGAAFLMVMAFSALAFICYQAYHWFK